MGLIILGVVVFFGILFLFMMIKLPKEYERIVVFRLGRCIGAKGPGVTLLIPVVDTPVWVDLREHFLEIPRQTCITKDNAQISIDFLIYWKVTDPVRSVLQVQYFAGATQGIATTTLRAVVGDDPFLTRMGRGGHGIRAEQLDEPGAAQQAQQRRFGGRVLPVSFKIEIEKILPGPVAARARLDFGQVDIALGELAQAVVERAG